MITELTKEQESELKATYIEYLKIGRDIAPVDFKKAEEDISALYTWGGFKTPQFLHFSSPMICELFINLICSSSPKLGGQLWDQLEGQLWGQLWDQLGGQLWDQLRPIVVRHGDDVRH